MIRSQSDASFDEGLSGRDIARLRWTLLAILAAGCALAILVFDAGLPAGTVIAVVVVGLAANALAARHASAITPPLLLDVVLIGVLLAMSGGLASTLAALLPVPAFVGALSTDPRSAGRVAALTVVVATLLAFTGGPGAWPAVCAMAALAALAGRRARMASQARREAVGALEQDRAANANGIAFAAAAHEISSPLSTIRIAAAELARNLEDRPEARADARLIEREALRCGAILDAMRGSGGSREPKPISEIVELAAEPHRDRGVDIRILSRGVGREPRVGPAGDVALGLRNIIQNAVDFADSEVTVEASWTAEGIEVTISDDGDGFDGDVLEGARPGPGRPRARGGPGTGRGVALARALLARSDGVIELENAAPRGARVRVAWVRTAEHG